MSKTRAEPITIPIPQGELKGLMPNENNRYQYFRNIPKTDIWEGFDAWHEDKYLVIHAEHNGNIEIIGKWAEITEEMAEGWGYEYRKRPLLVLTPKNNLKMDIDQKILETGDLETEVEDLLFIVVKNKEE